MEDKSEIEIDNKLIEKKNYKPRKRKIWNYDASKVDHDGLDNIPATAKQKILKVIFDCSDERDLALLKKLEELCSSKNTDSGLPRLKPADLLKDAIELINIDFVKKVQKSSLTDQDRLNFWTISYNRKNQTTLTPIEFAVRVLPNLKNKEIQVLEEEL